MRIIKVPKAGGPEEEIFVSNDKYIYQFNFPVAEMNPTIFDPIRNNEIAHQILSTLKFTDQKGKFCGGIAGIACPTGFNCKLDGNYPDAGGKCEEGKTGTLSGKVIKSPTCAGPQRVGQVCEAPYPNGEFMLYREEGGGNVHLAEIKPVKTDSLGKFTTDLEPGNYELRNTATGIGKDLGSNGFHIYAGQTTPVTFYVDTGIR